MLRLALAALHLLALGIGLGAAWARGRAMADAVRDTAALDLSAIRRAFAADAWWGAAAGMWIATGVWRLMGSTEKATDYYVANHLFRAKMGLLLLILLLELRPMITLIGWRRRLGGGVTRAPDEWRTAARFIALVSYLQAGLVIAMVCAAVAMARGFGAR